MALPASARPLRADLGQLTDLAFQDLAVVWSGLDSPASARQAIADIVPSLVDVYGSAAGTLSADWYDNLREREQVRRRFSAIVAAIPDDVGADALAGYASTPLFGDEPDWDSALTLLQGGLQRRILNVSRDTITTSSVADPSARGWMRVGIGKCDFCQMLLGRGAVYTQASADFQAHDHCGCSAMPAW